MKYSPMLWHSQTQMARSLSSSFLAPFVMLCTITFTSYTRFSFNCNTHKRSSQLWSQIMDGWSGDISFCCFYILPALKKKLLQHHSIFQFLSVCFSVLNKPGYHPCSRMRALAENCDISFFFFSFFWSISVDVVIFSYAFPAELRNKKDTSLLWLCFSCSEFPLFLFYSCGGAV